MLKHYEKAIETRKYGTTGRVILRLFTKDRATVGIRTGGKIGLSSVGKPAERRVFDGEQDAARLLAERLALSIDEYAIGCGIKPGIGGE